MTWGIDGSDELSKYTGKVSNLKKVQQNFRVIPAPGGKKANWQFPSFEHNEHQLEIARQMAQDEGFKASQTIIIFRKDTGGVKHKKIEVEELLV